MKRVVLIGFDPATVDFSDPALAARHDRRKDQRWGQTRACYQGTTKRRLLPEEIFQTGVCHIRHLPDCSDRSGISGRSRLWYQTSSHRSWDRIIAGTITFIVGFITMKPFHMD